jgi:hypothetical protein
MADHLDSRGNNIHKLGRRVSSNLRRLDLDRLALHHLGLGHLLDRLWGCRLGSSRLPDDEK